MVWKRLKKTRKRDQIASRKRYDEEYLRRLEMTTPGDDYVIRMLKETKRKVRRKPSIKNSL